MSMKMKNGYGHRDAFQQSIGNAFLQAIQIKTVAEAVDEYRTRWGLGGKAKTNVELENEIRQLFLRDVGLIDGAEFPEVGKIKVRDSNVYITFRSKEGTEHEQRLTDPFSAILGDKEVMLAPQAKLELIKILSNIETDKTKNWIFEPRLFARENMLVYPSSHLLTRTPYIRHKGR